MRHNVFNQPIGETVSYVIPDLEFPELIEGRYCSLERTKSQLHEEDLFEELVNNSSKEIWTYLVFGPFVNRIEFNGWLRKVELSTSVYYTIKDLNGNALGLASFMRIKPESGSIEIGGIVFSKAMQRTTISTEAIFKMIEWAFYKGYRRVEWKCDALNANSKKAALRLGFQFEGEFKNATMYKNRNRNTAWYAIVEEEWKMIQEKYNDWLDPRNFDSEGVQLKQLIIN
jgi:RimJ/RimL family protein N-acetyltransferase